MSDQEVSQVVGVLKETNSLETRVALVPDQITQIRKAGLTVCIEQGAGDQAGYPDSQYQEKGAVLCSREDIFSRSDILLKVSALGADLENGQTDLSQMKEGQTVIAFLDPLSEPKSIQEAANANVQALSMEMMPRITRAQSMDALSSMATIAGYKAVIIAADTLPKMFPMLMTAAGTVAAAKVFVIGAGVAGLQAIATAKRLGAVVEAYDVRPAVKEQIESLGAKFVEFDLETKESEDKGGYAKAQDEEFYRKQREMMAAVIAENDVVITTAAIPGKKSPVLVTTEMVQGMAQGSVIVDLAAERGGNCELTKGGETIVEHGVTIIGPLNIPSAIPYHASRMYSKNITTFLLHLVNEGQLIIDPEDEITAGTLMSHNGQVVHPRIQELLGINTESAS
jgi:NAD(P) transhydrogenase subunit alpha